MNDYGYSAIDALKHETAGLHTMPCSNCILIVEDYDAIRAFLARHFEQEGFTVYSACTPKDAQFIARTINPMIVIVDYDLSNTSALDALRDLRQLLPQSIIILSGGVESTSLAAKARLYGANALFSQGYELTRLDMLISQARSS